MRGVTRAMWRVVLIGYAGLLPLPGLEKCPLGAGAGGKTLTGAQAHPPRHVHNMWVLHTTPTSPPPTLTPPTPQSSGLSGANTDLQIL